MPHYYIEPSQIINDRFTLSGDEARHLIRVLRIKPGEKIDLFDGTGMQFHVVIETIAEYTLAGRVVSLTTAAPPAASVHLYCAIPKGDRFDWLVEKCSEIGVAAITPLITERSTMADVPDSKLDRWRRLSLAASKQCGRAGIMEIEPGAQFTVAAGSLKPGIVALLPWEGEGSTAIDGSLVQAGASVALFIGPEGGFTVREIEIARAHNVVPVTLGPSILRVETAAVIASVLVLDRAGQFTKKEIN